MEQDLSNQTEVLIQNVLCNKLSESDRNLLQSWLTSRLTIERCGWKRKVQDALQMLEVERKTSLETHSQWAKLYDDMLKVLPLKISESKNKLFFTNGIKNDPLEERVENLKAFKMKEVERMTRWLLMEYVKMSSHTNNEDGKNETMSIEVSYRKDVSNKCQQINGPEKCTELERIKKENLELKCYLENLSKIYQDILCKYSCLKGNCQQTSSTETTTTIHSYTNTNAKIQNNLEKETTPRLETHKDNRQRLCRSRLGKSVEHNKQLSIKLNCSRSLDIPPLDQLDLNESDTISKHSVISKESLCTDDSEGNYEAISTYDVNSTYDLNIPYTEHFNSDEMFKNDSNFVPTELVYLDTTYTTVTTSHQKLKPEQKSHTTPIPQTQQQISKSQLQKQTCHLQLPNNTVGGRSAVRRNERCPSVTINKTKSKLESNKIDKNKVKKKSKMEKKTKIV